MRIFTAMLLRVLISTNLTVRDEILKSFKKEGAYPEPAAVDEAGAPMYTLTFGFGLRVRAH